MKFPCEKIANTIIPAIRAEIAFKLSTEYGLKQIEISNILGVTQGAVSHYLTSFRGKEREMVKKNPEIAEKIDEIADMMVNGKFDEKKFCEICRKIRRLSSDI